jgi:hypothetical protein
MFAGRDVNRLRLAAPEVEVTTLLELPFRTSSKRYLAI